MKLIVFFWFKNIKTTKLANFNKAYKNNKTKNENSFFGYLITG